MTVEITRLGLSAAELREAATRTRDAKAARRMLAMALVLEGRSRDEAARSCGMDRQTLRDWAHRYNEGGLAGLSDRPRRNGPRPRLSAEQQAEVAKWVEEGEGFTSTNQSSFLKASIAWAHEPGLGADPQLPGHP
jgi:transposase